MASSTRCRVAGRTDGCSLITRDTVWWDTPASRATSKMFADRALPSSLLTQLPSSRRRTASAASRPDYPILSLYCYSRRVVSTRCRMMKISSRPPMKILVHHELSVPSKVMMV